MRETVRQRQRETDSERQKEREKEQDRDRQIKTDRENRQTDSHKDTDDAERNETNKQTNTNMEREMGRWMERGVRERKCGRTDRHSMHFYVSFALIAYIQNRTCIMHISCNINEHIRS